MDITFHHLIAKAFDFNFFEWFAFAVLLAALIGFFGWITRLVWRIPSDVWVFKVLAIFIALIGCVCIFVAFVVGMVFGRGCGPAQNGADNREPERVVARGALAVA